MKLMAIDGVTYAIIMFTIMRGFFIDASRHRRMHMQGEIIC